MDKTKTESTYSPKAILKELKKVSWAKLKTHGNNVGVLKNFFASLLFIAVFTGFFELCSLLFAFLLHLGGN